MSISYRDGITVQLVGEATREIFDLEVGESLGLRGPWATASPSPARRSSSSGAGWGAAPSPSSARLRPKRGAEVSTLLGFRCCDEILFRERFERIGELVMTTDDGSQGICGRASAGLPALHLQEFDQIYPCGPEPMMADIIGRCPGMETKIQASIDRYSPSAVWGSAAPAASTPPGSGSASRGRSSGPTSSLGRSSGGTREGPVASKLREGDSPLIARFLFDGVVRAGRSTDPPSRQTAGPTRSERWSSSPAEPSKVVCVGLNYVLHAKELKMDLPTEPIIFLKPSTAVIGPGADIVMPPSSNQVDYEGSWRR